MSQVKIDRAVEIMKANRLRYHRNFPKIFGIGFNDDAMEYLCNDIIAEIEKILLAGVNYGFNASMKRCVAELTEIAQKTCSDGFGRANRIDGLYTKKNACLAALVLTKNEDASDLREMLKGYIATAKKGMDILKNEGVSKTKTELSYESSCEKLLADIAKGIDNVVDFSSPEAVEKYNGIVTDLRAWRTSVARSGGFYDAKAVSPLRDILKRVEEWGKLCRAPVKHADAQEIMPVPEDDLSRVIASEAIRQSILMFLGRCDDYVYAVYEMSKTGVAENVRDLRARLADARNEQQKLEDDRNRGRVTPQDYDYFSKQIQNAIDTMEFDLGRIQLDDVSRYELQLRREMISRIEQPIKSSYNHVKSNRIHVYNLFSGMDFSRIIALLNNNLSAREMEDGITEIQNTLIARGFIDRQGNVLLENLKSKLGDEYDSAWHNG
ncbi:MAG: hypothetical protein IJX27_00615 [Clostridia bacterium]|nr:hypothetical protein [Clostridia bacterium]